MIEGTADAATLRARLQAKTGKAVNVVISDGGSVSSDDASPPPPAPVVLEMKLQTRSRSE